MSTFLLLLCMLVLILAASEVFVNALEHLGERLRISDGVTGSIFAAVGTALPETMIPLIALLAGGANTHVNEEIGVGAVLGAPLMLSTLSVSLMALVAVKGRGLRGLLRPESVGLRRDLNFCLIALVLSLAAMYMPPSHPGRLFMSAVLVALYLLYLLLTVRASKDLVQAGHGTEAHAPLYLNRLGLPHNLGLIVAQLVLGLLMLVGGAKGFIHGVESASQVLGISALLLSLLIIPIATELPEKVNSILWIRRGKDTLAFGNITGALVFQGTLLPALGILLTPWTPRIEVLMGVVVTFVATIWLRLRARSGGMPAWTPLVNGALYVSYLTLMLSLTT